ncbi:hypothetical protein FGM00_19620 [Aggregatimonas sangjinii]|uniref:DUF3575 domain-containing protein n=1 Tax=Aggregatimonas sangjinii TaxID=2583587 RepID=A0A5B7SUL3_9FLAO|nr:hypothetical protein [Aggregatimonas sangjinii]QCX02217.1 hypothetical protein FGM00_19620 [Aggregatimonas sangjinii]
MKRSIFYLLVLLLGAQMFSQKADTNPDFNTNSYISINPLPLADPFTPRLRVGYVQHIKNRIKVGVDIGYGNDVHKRNQEAGESYRLWELRPEVYYVLKPEAKTIKYISAEFFYINQENRFVNGDYEREDGVDIDYDSADYERQKYGMHLKFGLFLDIGKRLGFNFYGGVGFRFRNNEYTNVVNPQEGNVIREWYVGSEVEEGSDFRLNPSLGFKFYYKL